ncbi:hypothetical protein ACWATR_37180 [Nostoc sp. UIC 10890]
MPKLNVGSIELGDFDRDWFIVASKLLGRSVRANLASVTAFYIRRRTQEFKELLAYTAKKHGISEDECFQILLSGKELPPPVAGFDEAPPEVDTEE